MTVILQITPEIGSGTGVGGVAAHLEAAWQAQGVEVRRFTLEDAGGAWIPRGRGGPAGKLALIARVVWFSTVGTVGARRYLRAHPECVSVCHNDAVVGDVYVNHGILRAAMQARGRAAWRMVRNPLHLFTEARDTFRYSARGPHRLVVNLSRQDDRTLHAMHRNLRSQTTVIGNGVDIERYQPATPAERQAAKRELGLDPTVPVVLFVGHEYERKGLPLVVEAVGRLARRVDLVVVGGSPAMIEQARRTDPARALGDRVHFVGSQPDARPWLRAADVFALPSAYEASPLVVLEALASGVPVVASAVGGIPDVVEDGVNGHLVALDAESVAAGLEAVLTGDAAVLGGEARSRAEQHSWDAVARRYLAAIEGLRRSDQHAFVSPSTGRGQ